MSTKRRNLEWSEGAAGPVLEALAGGEPRWEDGALCAQVDPSLFYPEQGDAAAAERAKSVCAACEPRGECLAWALENGGPCEPGFYGVWGGASENERRAMRRAMRRRSRRAAA